MNFFRDCAIERIKKSLETHKVTTVKINFTGTLLNTGYHFLNFTKTIMCDELKFFNVIKFNDKIIYCCKVGLTDVIAFERNKAFVPENNITFYTEKTKIVYDNEKNQVQYFSLSRNEVYVEEEIYCLQKIETAALEKGFSFVYEDIAQVLKGKASKLPNVSDVLKLREEFEHEL